ncbi:MAG TPA: MoaF C-terminal domain-containing protein [Steroidobacteraceae bacterium]|nr:MoaF C-terminal domain-containing protein [Steroidobacteraceae bacterium]
MGNQGSNWLQVGELTTGFGGNELTRSDELAGTQHQLTFADGSRAHLAFDDSGELSCTAVARESEAAALDSRSVATVVTSSRPQIFFVDYLPSGRGRDSVSLVIDRTTGIGTAVLGRLPTREETERPLFVRAGAHEELTPVTARLLPFTLSGDAPSPERRHEATAELVGRRILYDYGQRDSYEHVYLNERYYTWHCLRGPEKGLADTDRCYYNKVAPDLHLFVWLEKIVPTLGIVLVDLRAWRSTGKIFGYRGADFGAVANAQVGARARLLNVTAY